MSSSVVKQIPFPLVGCPGRGYNDSDGTVMLLWAQRSRPIWESCEAADNLATATAHFAADAANACYQINPEDPQRVADSMARVFELAYQLSGGDLADHADPESAAMLDELAELFAEMGSRVQR